MGAALRSGDKLDGGDYLGATGDFGYAVAELFTIGGVGSRVTSYSDDIMNLMFKTASKGGIRTVDDLLAAGTKLPKVKGGGQISVKGNIDDVFNSVSKGGKTETLVGGRVKTTLPDSTTLTKYPAGSGGPTIQVNQGGKITKVRFE